MCIMKTEMKGGEKMKKTLKISVILAIIAMLMLTLTGCGNDSKKKSENNNLVATKSGEDSFFGKYEETVEISFKDDKADKIVMTRDLEDEEKAESISSVFEYLDESEMEGMKVERDGKKIIITLEPKTFAEQESLNDEDLSRDSLKKELEEDGYTIK